MPSRGTQKLLSPNNYVFVEPPRAAHVPFMMSERDMWSWFSHPLLREGWIPRLAPRLAHGTSYFPSRRSIPLRRADLTPADDCTHVCICIYIYIYIYIYRTQYIHTACAYNRETCRISRNYWPERIASVFIQPANLFSGDSSAVRYLDHIENQISMPKMHIGITGISEYNGGNSHDDAIHPMWFHAGRRYRPKTGQI